jgi:CHAT domain-containing protein
LDVPTLQQLLDRQDVTGAIQYVERGWQAQFESYYQGRLSTQLLDAATISRRLADLFGLTGTRSALIYAIPTPNHLELIVVPPGGAPVHHRVTLANRTMLMEAVNAFKREVMSPISSRTRYLPPAQKLYQLMIAPLETTLKRHRIDTLIFCLGNGLRTVPIAALHDGKRFLVEKYNLALIPAFNLLDSRPVSLKDARVLAMGASEFDTQIPLPAVPVELQTIATQLWPGAVLLNQNFTVDNLKSFREKQLFRIVHLATHADFAPGSVQDSYIQFWDQRVSPNRFQMLQLNFPEVELLVLSACRTAVGDPQAELGFAGLAVMSGSRAAIASLWSVSDAGTLALMTEFYRQLKTVRKASALRTAQVAMIQQTLPRNNEPINTAHPYYWAAFTVIGNPW